MKEYAIWGIPENQEHETLLLAQMNGQFITDIETAENMLKILVEKYNCKNCRIQTLDGQAPNFRKVLK